jgi:undecaprenyl diphosphate synthase
LSRAVLPLLLDDTMQKSLADFQKRHPSPLAHVAIIMDGNRRWAKERLMPSLMGHKEGSKRLKEIITGASFLGVQVLTVYAFSTENWKRTTEEVGYLMKLMAEVLSKDLELLGRLGVCIKVLGNREALPFDLKTVLETAIEQTADNTGLQLHLAINYGGRAEITQAIQRIALAVQAGTLAPEAIEESTVTDYLNDADTSIPTPDLVIRTSGEQRLSNFLIWQSAYSELYFTPVPWPAFTVEHFCEALSVFWERKRRFGE